MQKDWNGMNFGCAYVRISIVKHMSDTYSNYEIHMANNLNSVIFRRQKMTFYSIMAA